MKPIRFNIDMVRAILDGRKKQTRRLIKPKYRDDEYGFQVVTNKATGERWVEKYNEDEGPFGSARYVLPRYKVGDILYVRETFGNYSLDNPRSRATGWVYKADYPDGAKGYWYEPEKINWCDLPRWRPSIHMPQEAARIFLRVTNVRVEQLQDVSEEDAKAEGAYLYSPDFIPTYHYKSQDTPGNGWTTARECFLWGIWDKTLKRVDYEEYNHRVNPWVWVYAFEVCEKNKE